MIVVPGVVVPPPDQVDTTFCRSTAQLSAWRNLTVLQRRVALAGPVVAVEAQLVEAVDGDGAGLDAGLVLELLIWVGR